VGGLDLLQCRDISKTVNPMNKSHNSTLVGKNLLNIFVMSLPAWSLPVCVATLICLFLSVKR
jgi:hypothetical protein